MCIMMYMTYLTHISVSHAAEHSHCFAFPSSEKGCGLRTAAFQQILEKNTTESAFNENRNI